MRDLRKIWKMMLAIALAGACSEDGGASDDDDGDDDPPPTEPGPPAPTTGTVTGKWYTRCRWEGKEFDFLLDHREKVIQALVPASHSPTGYRVIEGEGYSDSTFSIPNVPLDVTYVLRLGIGYYRTDQRVIDARGDYRGRCGPLPAKVEAPTLVSFSLTGLAPYQRDQSWRMPADELLIDARELPYWSYALSSAPAAEATSVDATIDWGTGGWALPEAARGDSVYVLQNRRTVEDDLPNRGEHYFTRIVRALHLPPLTLQSGAPASVTGALHPPVERAFSIMVDRAQLEPPHDPSMVPGHFDVELLTERHHPIFAALLLYDVGHVSSPLEHSYGDPFPSPWGRLLTVRNSYLRWFQLPGSGGRWYQHGGRYHQRVVEGALASPRPITASPTGALLHGFDFTRGGLVPFDGQGTVNLRWQPAAGATSYRIGVHRMSAEEVGAEIAVLRTSGTSFDMPGEIFEEGAHYMFYLSAIAGSNDYARGEILPDQLQSYTDLISGRFFFSSACGDGIIQEGEECDTAGESATCNIDCSSSSCGDGLHNATAGEACDGAGFDAIGCDSNCTLATCGDGYRNHYAEQCDDGDATDSGNGCSATCTANNVCGNSVVESAFEACDTGGDSVSCDADCSMVFCGDGHVNVAAGEECDDGFFNHERCSPTCQLLEP